MTIGECAKLGAGHATTYKCQKLNHFANVCKANIQQTHLVEKINK